jgi:hypothetical protein
MVALEDGLRCPVAGCTRHRRGVDELMCPTHWYMVPRPLRSRVWLAWRRYQHGPGTIEQLRAAQGAAVEAVERAEGE